ncbi:MAG: tRNA lysidine(34) synthetase TilS [Butyricicoccus sp.]|nr:tRNA lysidine(34) synthetase TilS [Butyricicoccus sp.]
MDKFLHTIAQTIAENEMLAPDEPVLVALSGGADSVTLTLALRELGYPVRACHVHHGLRGAEADRDAQFCRDFCRAHTIELDIRCVDAAAHAKEHRQSIETAAREVRYAALEQAARGHKIATAHTANDNLETMLFHLARGTGAAGLAGIPPVRGAVIRPLLGCTGPQIEPFWPARGKGFVTDSTNASDVHTRNRIRHTVIPALLAVHPGAVQNAGALSARLRQDDAFLEQEAAKLLAHAAQGDGWRVEPLKDAHPALRTRALRQLCADRGVPRRDFTARHIQALEALLQNPRPSARTDLPAGFVAQREYGLLKLENRVSGPEIVHDAVPVRGCGTFGSPDLRVSIRRLEKNQVFYKSFNTFCVDCDTIDMSTCTLRTRRTGDRLRLTEHGGSKTLKKLLIDKKIPSARRDHLAVLADQNGLIAVQGVGIDISSRPQGGAIFEIQFEG